MKQIDSNQKTNPQNMSTVERPASAGPSGIAIMPPVDGKEEQTRHRFESNLPVLQRDAMDPSPVGQVPAMVHEVLRSPGQPLDDATRAFMEPRFGHDFSHVRLHTDAKAAESARAVNANAYTVGQDVVFGTGKYVPDTRVGRGLIAHELTHVVQQRKKGTLLIQRQRRHDEEEDSPNPIATWVHPSNSLLLIHADDQMFVLPARNIVWVPDPASQSQIRSAIPHLATDLGALMEAPATGASGTRIFRAGRRSAMILDAGADPRAAIPAAVYLNEFQGVMANLGLTNVSQIRVIHVHQDHVSGIPSIVMNSRVRADRVVIPAEYIGVNREIRQVVTALQGTTDQDLIARGFGSGWTPGTRLRDRGGTGDVFRYRYTLGELVVESVALRSALRTTAATPDLASYLTKVTRTADLASIVILGDLRGRDLAAIRAAMETQRPGSWNEFFSGVTTLSGFSHHAGRMEDRDVPGMMSLLDATLLRQGRLRVVEQTSRTTHARARSDTLELMSRLGVETAIAELPAQGAASGAGATRETLYQRGPAATRIPIISSTLTAGMTRLSQLLEARETIETWRPWFVEVGGSQAEREINNLFPEIDRSVQTLQQALRTATQTALQVRTGGDPTTTGGRDYSTTGGTRGQAHETALSTIPTATPAETMITPQGFSNLQRLRSLPASEIPLRVAVHAAMVRGVYSDQAFAHMLSELEPSRRTELLTGPRGGQSPRHVAFQRVRAEYNFRRSVLGGSDVMSIPRTWSGGARFAAAAVNWVLLALEVWNAVGQPLVEARQLSQQTFTGQNLLPFLRRLLFWDQMSVRPKVVGVTDPTIGSIAYERNYDTVLTGLRENRWDALYFEEPVLLDLDVMRLGVWLSYHIRNFDEFSVLFEDSAQDAVTWETTSGGGWGNAQWKVKAGRYELSGTNHVVESWHNHAGLTRLMNVFTRRIIANTGTLLMEWGESGRFSPETVARLGELEFGGAERPQYRTTLRVNSETTEVWVQPQGRTGAISSSAPPRLQRSVRWWTPPLFFVYRRVGDFTEVSGSDYNTYAILRGLPSERHTPVISGGTIGADQVSVIGNEHGKVWIRNDLLANPP